MRCSPRTLPTLIASALAMAPLLAAAHVGGDGGAHHAPNPTLVLAILLAASLLVHALRRVVRRARAGGMRRWVAGGVGGAVAILGALHSGGLA